MGEIEQAKKTLREAGYNVDVLWKIEDVTDIHYCTDKQAQHILKGALSNEAVMEQIWFAIDFEADKLNLEKW
jgi:hypothetical protein